MSSPADLLSTMALCAALKAKLAAIAHPTLAGQPLFSRVEYHESTQLAEALEQLIVTKQRVAFIVPQGDRWAQSKTGRILVSTCVTTIDLVLADQAYTRGGNDAAFGGPNNIGVVAMKDLVLRALAADPQLGGLRWCALYPTDGAPLEVSASDAKAAPGRQAWVQSYETPSGEISTPITAAWTN